MAALTLFPLQYKRQDSVPVDIDQTFASTAARLAYLTSPRRYAGQIVVDNEDQLGYFLNSARNAWIPIGGLQIQYNGVNVGGPDAYALNYQGASLTASRLANEVTVNVSAGGPASKWAQFPIHNTITGANTSRTLNAEGVVVPIIDYLVSNSGSIPGLGTVTVPGGEQYVFTPFQVILGAPEAILYALTFDLKATIGATPNSNRRVTLYGRSSFSSGLTGLLFRKDVYLKTDVAGVLYCNEAFHYLHLAANVPIFLNIETDTVNPTVIEGSWTVTEIGRIATPAPNPPGVYGSINNVPTSYADFMPDGAVMWFDIQFSADSHIQIDTLGSDFDTLLALYDAAGNPILVNDNGLIDLTSVFDYTFLTGVTYYLALTSSPAEVFDQFSVTSLGTGGSWFLNVNIYSTPPPSIVMDIGSVPSSSGPVTVLANEVVWAAIFLPSNTLLRLDTNGADFDTEIALYDADGLLIDSNDDEPLGDTWSQLDVSVLASTDYYLAIGPRPLVLGSDFAVTSSGTPGGSVTLNASVTPAMLGSGWNPADNSVNFPFTLSNVDHIATGTTPPASPNTAIRGLTGHDSGIFYFELASNTSASGDIGFGFASADADLDSVSLGTAGPGMHLVIYGGTGDIYTQDSDSPVDNIGDIALDDVIGFGLEFSSNTCYIYKNGSFVTQLTIIVPGTAVYPYFLSFGTAAVASLNTTLADIQYPGPIGVFTVWG